MAEVELGGLGLEEPLPSASSTQQRRRKNEQSPPPLLALGFGPFSIPLLPPLPPRSPSPEPEPEVEPHGAAAVGPPSTSSVAGNSGGSPVERLWAALAQRDPHLAERLAGTGEALDAAALSRWLAARHGDIEAATAGIVAHAAWREVFVGSGSPGGISEASIARELAARKVFLQGCDAAGRPVVVVQAGRHDMGRRDLAETKSLIAYVLDSSCATADIARNPMGRICCLFDLSGLRPRNLDVKALLAIFEMLQQHYPERLDSLFFLNAPLLFWGVWRLVCPFLHAATKRKVHFVSGGNERQALLDRMGPEVLPHRYGGAVELVPIDGAMTAWRRQQAVYTAAAAAAEASAATSGGGRSGLGKGQAAKLRRRAGLAAHAAQRFVHGALVRPVGGAAVGMVRALRRHHHLLLRRHEHAGLQPSQQQLQQRSLLAQVVLTHVLLVGLLLRMLQRVLLRRPGTPASPKSLPQPDAQVREEEEGAAGGGSLAKPPTGPASEA